MNNNVLSDSEKLKKVIRDLDLNANKLAVSLGLRGNTMIYHILKGRNGISEGFAYKLCKRYPQISIDWLLKGEGNMKSDGSQVAEAPQTPSNYLEGQIKGIYARLDKLENLHSKIDDIETMLLLLGTYIKKRDDVPSPTKKISDHIFNEIKGDFIHQIDEFEKNDLFKSFLHILEKLKTEKKEATGPIKRKDSSLV